MRDRPHPLHAWPLSLDGISQDLSCMHKRPWVSLAKMGERGVFCRSAKTSSQPLQARLAGESPQRCCKKSYCSVWLSQPVLQVHQSLSNGLGYAGSHRRANGSSESVSGLSMYAIVMIIVKEGTRLSSATARARFPMPNINSS